MTQHVRKGYRNHRKGTWAAVLVVLAAAAMAIALPASGAAEKKVVTASFSDMSWDVGSTVTVDLSIQNGSGSQQLGSGDLCIPAGFTVTESDARAEVAGTDAGSPCPTGKRVKLRNLAIPASSALNPAISLTIQVPCSSSDPAVWRLYAKQSNDFSGLPGNNFTPYPFAINVSVTGACTLEFVTQPADVVVGDSLVAKNGGSAIQVLAKSGGIPIGGIEVTIGPYSAGFTVDGKATTGSGTGIASFSSLTPSPVGGPYRLTASAPGFTLLAPSDEFFVLDLACEPGQPCSVTKALDTQTSVTASQTGFDVPVGLLVDGTATAQTGLCGSGLTAVGSNFRIEVRPLDGYTQITWRYTKSERLKKPDNGQTYELCVGTKFASDYTGTLSPAFPVANGDGVADEDPNDVGRYWGILTDAPSSAKCDSSYPLWYPAKIAEYANGADAIQVACFPYPFDPKGIGVG